MQNISTGFFFLLKKNIYLILKKNEATGVVPGHVTRTIPLSENKHTSAMLIDKVSDKPSFLIYDLNRIEVRNILGWEFYFITKKKHL